ncbi:MAG: hypothetical protein US76_02555 [Parcubacteria group bacterium GW2011_GWA2_38_13b]|nr:MAG: hypothetical protein US76_02555 [Parcubacteria group bacterium GW2011_GWA2_38_13b]
MYYLLFDCFCAIKFIIIHIYNYVKLKFAVLIAKNLSAVPRRGFWSVCRELPARGCSACLPAGRPLAETLCAPN